MAQKSKAIKKQEKRIQFTRGLIENTDKRIQRLQGIMSRLEAIKSDHEAKLERQFMDLEDIIASEKKS